MAQRVPNQQETVNPSQDERTPEQGEIGTMDSIGISSRGEIEVDNVTPQVPRPQGPAPIPTVTVRLNEDIEQMTWSANGRFENYNFTAGHRYQVPIYIAQELENLGKLWH